MTITNILRKFNQGLSQVMQNGQRKAPGAPRDPEIMTRI